MCIRCIKIETTEINKIIAAAPAGVVSVRCRGGGIFLATVRVHCSSSEKKKSTYLPNSSLPMINNKQAGVGRSYMRAATLAGEK